MDLTDLQITEHPIGGTFQHCSPVTLSVSAVGSGSLSYHWKKNGKDLTQTDFTGTDTPTLKISSFMPEHEGSYKCVVSDGQKFVESHPAELKISKCCLTICCFSVLV